MNLKKVLAVFSAVIVAGAFLLMVLGQVHYIVFLVVAALNAIFAYRILPRMK